jgi:membrane protein implicated in regulation of membrane protease activity
MSKERLEAAILVFALLWFGGDSLYVLLTDPEDWLLAVAITVPIVVAVLLVRRLISHTSR